MLFDRPPAGDGPGPAGRSSSSRSGSAGPRPASSRSRTGDGPRASRRAGPQAPARRRPRPEHRRDGRLRPLPDLPVLPSSTSSSASIARSSPTSPSRDAIPRRPVRGPDVHRARPGAPRMQREVRRSGDAGHPALTGSPSAAPAAAARGRLGRPPERCDWTPRCCGSCRRRVGIVLAAAAIRDRPDTAPRSMGSRPPGERRARVPCGTARDDAGVYRTAGGRVLTVVARGTDLAAARAAAEARPERSPSRAASAVATSRWPSPRRPTGARVSWWARPPDRPGRPGRPGRPTDPVPAGIPGDPPLHPPGDGRRVGDEARFEQMLRVEIAVAEAQAERGLIRPRRPPRSGRGRPSTWPGSPRSSRPPTTTSSPSSARWPSGSAPRAASCTSG